MSQVIELLTFTSIPHTHSRNPPPHPLLWVKAIYSAIILLLSKKFPGMGLPCVHIIIFMRLAVCVLVYSISEPSVHGGEFVWFCDVGHCGICICLSSGIFWLKIQNGHLWQIHLSFIRNILNKNIKCAFVADTYISFIRRALNKNLP